MSSLLKISILFFLFSSPLLAQKKKRERYTNMTPVVPEELIPSAPVLSVEEALKSFTIAEGFIIEPVAVEPMVEKPVAIKFDGQGRLWVVEMRGYMPDLDGKDEKIPQGRIAVLEDTTGDGQVDTRTIFLDKIHLPRSIALVKDGVLIGDQRRLYFCGRDGNNRTSEPVIVDKEYAPTGNVEHKPNSLLPHLNNWLYCAKGRIRYRWQNGKLQRDSTQFRGQWGLAMDNFGRLYHNSNRTILRGDRLLPETVETFESTKMPNETSEQLCSNRVYPIRVTPGTNGAHVAVVNGYDKNVLDPKTYKLIRTTSACGPLYYRGDQLPKAWHGVVFVSDPVANIVKATRVDANDLVLTSEHVFKDSEFLASTDERFRPVNMHTGPDGSLYLVDYYHGLIQHKTYLSPYLRDYYQSLGLESPSYELGRIYRIRHQDKPLGPQPQLLEATSEELIKTLAHPNGWWRDTAQRLLVERKDASTEKPLKDLLLNHPNEFTRIHALWTLAGIDGLSEGDFKLIGEHLMATDQQKLIAHLLTLATDKGYALFGSPQRQASYRPSNAVEPYWIRYSLNQDAANFDLAPHLKAPFAAEVAATALLSQGLTEFPKTESKLDSYLQEASNSKDAIPPKERLSGKHLASFQRGKKLYTGMAACIGCHGADGRGMPNLGPPLDGSEWVTEAPQRLAKVLLHGLLGPITVAGIDYKPLAAMPGLVNNPVIKDQDLADIMTYLRAEWSNTASQVSEADVKKVRIETRDRNGQAYTAKELNPADFNPAELEQKGFLPLFNGTDLSGWKAVGGTGKFEVIDGSIRGFGKPVKGNTFLRTEETYRDFELTFQIKMVDTKGNSGCQFRSQQREGDGVVFGYQCEHSAKSPDGTRAYTAGIYDEQRRKWLFPSKRTPKEVADAFTEQGNRLFKWDDWNTITIRCQGRHIQTWLNGEKRTDLHDTDKKNFTPEGFIALQVHNGRSANVSWKNLYLKKL